MYICKCGHWRCAGTVSRSTWYRHKLAMILQARVDVDNNVIDEPLPVEDAPLEAEEDLLPADMDEKEVHMTRIF